MAYTKLHQSLVTSTIWREPNATRIVWVTMMAMADKNGEVMASIPGLADMSRVSIEECEAALLAFLSPDKYSRTKTMEGRRIQEIKGGWFLINHPDYRAMASKEDYTQKASLRMARHRRNKALQSVTVTKSLHIAEAEAEAEAEKQLPSSSSEKTSMMEFEEFWKLYPRKTGKAAALKAWSKHCRKGVIDKIRATLSWEVKCEQWQKDGGQFIPHPATWLNQERWTDEPLDKPEPQKPKFVV